MKANDNDYKKSNILFQGEVLLRLEHVIAPNGPIPVSKSTWWAGVKSNRFPKPVKIGDRITCWKSSDIDQLLRNINDGEV